MHEVPVDDGEACPHEGYSFLEQHLAYWVPSCDGFLIFFSFVHSL